MGFNSGFKGLTIYRPGAHRNLCQISSTFVRTNHVQQTVLIGGFAWSVNRRLSLC